jgi:CheY-like chemotaxis protein
MRILIADDHEVIRKGVIRVLQSRGDVEYAEAADGRKAVDKAIGWKPDLVLLDVRVPVLSGFDARDRSDSTSLTFLSCFFRSTIRVKSWKRRD